MLRRLKERDPEAGFTLVELSVALGVLFLALLAMAQTAVVGFRDTGFARQRQTANQIANQLIEEVRGLAYEHVTKGLADEDLAGDPTNIKLCGLEYYFKVCPPDPAAEVIVHTQGLLATPVTPLVPHQGTYGPPDYPSDFDWSVYVTEAKNVPEAGAFRVWAIVTWANPQNPGASNSVETQTLIFSPTGCQDTTTHPFGAPCQAYHQGTAAINGGGSQTVGTAQGVTFDAFMVDMLTLNSTVQEEQVVRVDGSSALPGGRRIVAGVENTVGRVTGTSQADTDPSTPAGPYDDVSLGPQGSESSAVTGTSTTITVASGGGDTGATTAATAANATNPCTVQSDGRACSYAVGRHQGALTHTVRIPEDGGTATLVSVGNNSTPSLAYARRQIPVAGTDGLVRARVERIVPEVRLGGLPDRASAPAGWAGYWARLVNYTATVQVEAGVNTNAPTLVLTGTLEYWNGSGYTSVTVTPGGAVVTPAAVSVPVTGPNFGSGSADLSGTIEIKSSSTSQTVGTPNTTRASAEAIAGPPLFAEVSYEIRRGANTVVDLDLFVNLGRAVARTSYEPAPTP
ncbi:MAG TPA: hypothetical protein VF097_02020 [Actinomycetota bacterium]